jgi:hypothetical protein
MGGVDLPLVQPGTPIVKALETLRARKRAAVVMDAGFGTSLIKIGALSAAQRAGMQTVGEVAGAIPLEPGPAATVLSVLNFQYAPMLGASTAGFAQDFVAGPRAGDTILVVTNHEYHADALLNAFVCDGRAPDNGDPPHFFPEPDVAANQNCPLCVTSGAGRPPTVRPFD